MSLSFTVKQNYPQDDRDHYQIWEDHLTNVAALMEAGILRITREAGYLNERPEVFNEMFGLSSAPEMNTAEQIGQIATDHQVDNKMAHSF